MRPSALVRVTVFNRCAAYFPGSNRQSSMSSPRAGAPANEVECVRGQSAHVGQKLTDHFRWRKVFLAISAMRIISHPRLSWLWCLGLAVFLPGRPASAQLVKKSIDYEQGTRSWYEHVPASYDGTKAVPLVVALHGAFSSGDQFAPESGWMDVADANGFIVLFPNGEGSNTTLVWHSWTFDGTKPDDIGFLLKVINKVQTTYHIDATRIYMTGFSNGGGMTSFFAAAHTDLLAAIAPMSAGWVTITGTPESVLKPDAPVPAWVWRGAQDNGPGVTPPLATQDQQQTQFWANLAGDATTPQVTTLGPATTYAYTGGKGGEVRFTSVAGLGHAIQPGSTARIWTEFFSRFSRVDGAIRSTGQPTIKVKTRVRRASVADDMNGLFVLSRDSGTANDLTVGYDLSGTAMNGVDYRLLPGTATLPAGASSRKVRVHPLASADATGAKTVRLTLLPGDDYLLGDPATAKVKVVEGQ